MDNIYQNALALLNEAEKVMGLYRSKALMLNNPAEVALCRAIEQHEAFRQEVSDAVVDYFRTHYVSLEYGEPLERFIMPAPKPDQLVEAMADCGVDRFESWADQLRAALEARGLEIREKRQ